jgi:hypothetical protein
MSAARGKARGTHCRLQRLAGTAATLACTPAQDCNTPAPRAPVIVAPSSAGNSACRDTQWAWCCVCVCVRVCVCVCVCVCVRVCWRVLCWRCTRTACCATHTPAHTHPCPPPPPGTRTRTRTRTRSAAAATVAAPEGPGGRGQEVRARGCRGRGRAVHPPGVPPGRAHGDQLRDGLCRGGRGVHAAGGRAGDGGRQQRRGVRVGRRHARGRAGQGARGGDGQGGPEGQARGRARKGVLRGVCRRGRMLLGLSVSVGRKPCTITRRRTAATCAVSPPAF